jgi:hypothetical protein
LLTDRDKISNLYRGPSIDASYQVSVHLAEQFQRRIFLDIDQSEKKIEKASEMQQPSCKSNSFGQTGFLFSRFINVMCQVSIFWHSGSQEEDF